MIIMVTNNTGFMAGLLAGQYPGRIGHLYSPGGFKYPYDGIPYALDNGRYAATTKGHDWDENAFLGMLSRVMRQCNEEPRWVVVPDAVGSRDRTLREWDKWAPRLQKDGWALAMAVQDDMKPEDVPGEAEVVFVGGTTLWKRRTIHMWCEEFSRVHVGRINTEKWLWACHRVGAESTDGTGWFRGSARQLNGLKRYLERTDAGFSEPGVRLPYEEDSPGAESEGGE